MVVSIFVNPMQFAPGEDLDRYPRTFDADLELCAEHGADIVFAPSVEEVYPGGDPQVTVEPGPLASVLEGASRPTHFRGVLTVVAKLFGLVRPDVAVFGEKDYQQLVLIRRMVSDLCMGVDVVGADIVREEGGLALSSRNRYLDEDQRWRAKALSRTLFAARDAAKYGSRRGPGRRPAPAPARPWRRPGVPRADRPRARTCPRVRPRSAADRRPRGWHPADRQRGTHPEQRVLSRPPRRRTRCCAP